MKEECQKKPRKYRQLTQSDRDRIAILLAIGFSVKDTALIIEFHQSTIYRELERNRNLYDEYLPSEAHDLAKKRKSNSNKGARILCKYLWEAVEFLLKKGWSPNCIAGTLKNQRAYFMAVIPRDLADKLLDSTVSHETIYKYIYDCKPELYRQLKRKRKTRQNRAQYANAKSQNIVNRVDIGERPDEANQRSEFGHFEADTMVSRQSKEAIAVVIDRRYRFVFIRRLTFKGKEPMKNAIVSCLKPFQYMRNCLKTITYDNGTENMSHCEVNAILGTDSYFARPYRSCDKGSVEQVIGLIRQYLPKKTDFSLISQERLDEIARTINERPRKCLGYKSPLQCMLEHFGFALQP